jgi:hypothetical protein
MKKLLGIMVLGIGIGSNAFAGWKDNINIVACGSSYENTGDLRTTYYAYNKEYIWYDWSVSQQSFQKSVPVTHYDKKKIKGQSSYHRVELYDIGKDGASGFVFPTQNNLRNCKIIKNLP